jgi:hypothetical protein
MRIAAFGLLAVLLLSASFPLASGKGTPASGALPTIGIIPASGPIGTLVTINGTKLPNSTALNVLFENAAVDSIVTFSDGSFSGQFIVPMVNSGNYTISIAQPNGTVITQVKTFDVTFGLDNLREAILAIQSNQTSQSGQLGSLPGLGYQLTQISSTQSAQSALLQNINRSNQQSLTIYLIVTIAALAVAAFSSYSLYKLKKARFEELEVIQ